MQPLMDEGEPIEIEIEIEIESLEFWASTYDSGLGVVLFGYTSEGWQYYLASVFP